MEIVRAAVAEKSGSGIVLSDLAVRLYRGTMDLWWNYRGMSLWMIDLEACTHLCVCVCVGVTYGFYSFINNICTG